MRDKESKHEREKMRERRNSVHVTFTHVALHLYTASLFLCITLYAEVTAQKGRRTQELNIIARIGRK
jgi:hypothetical protein